jgi:uncharacterized SAM-binding protein YcdF (DUF218 family)
MAVLADLVKSFVPGSMAFLLLAVTLGVALLYSSRAAAWGRRWLVLTIVLYLALATPGVAIWLEDGLHPAYPRLERAADARGVSAIVVLGNGAVTYAHDRRQLHGLTRRTAMNVLEGARLRMLLPPARVIVSGGVPDGGLNRKPEAELMADAMASLGVPRAQLVIEGASRNTHEQSVKVADLLKPGERIVLVTTPIHMSRALTYFKSRGFDAVPSPAPIEYTTHPLTWRQLLVPDAGALRMSELTIYERLAMALGWARGWSATNDAPH